VLTAAEEISDSTPDERDQENERREEEHNNIADDMKGVAPDIKTPMPNGRIANPIGVRSRLSAERKKEITVGTALLAFEFSAVTAVPKASLLVRCVTRQRTRGYFHWHRVGHVGVVVAWSNRVAPGGAVGTVACCHSHRPASSSIVVVDVVSDSNHDVSRRVMYRLAARA